MQLGKAFGYRVLADAGRADVELVAALGADEIVARGPGVADRFRALADGGVDAVVDAALIGASLVPAIRRGGTLAHLRDGDPEIEARGITLVPVFVHAYDGRRDRLDMLRRLAEDGALSLRVAGRFAPEQAAQAHKLLEAGGVRGRLILEF